MKNIIKEQHPIHLAHLCEVDAYAHHPVFIGEGGQGLRLIFPGAEGGTLKGDLLNGSIRAIGGDWARIRPDYAFELDVRLIIDTDDGAVIYVNYSGIIDMNQQQVEQYMKGIVPENLNIYVRPKFETSHEKYQWLNKACVVGKGIGQTTDTGFSIKYSWYIVE
ncbi:DUF3237 domain-containing protein [Labilibaculum sp. K2S]|uniref:DUF3237 domain-containing protein n=1 Tax=Labilibaculum sp. K2S TaxID=3056386 RepID=UPI0025A3B6C7|nr:DUF3237 domain-containing protein [Labilibaculum sp. K2S]MDM8162159.1 DUF3237 domain-containing protein [Labilibaculum sp. K2S]